jgi:hypothetical protein
MLRFGLIAVITASLFFLVSPCHSADNQRLVLENHDFSITFAREHSQLILLTLLNRQSGQQISLSNSDGFLLGIGKPEPGTSRRWLSLRDFVLRNWSVKENAAEFDLENEENGLACRWRWTMADAPYVRISLQAENKSSQPVSIADVDVLALNSGSNAQTDPLTTAEADSDNYEVAPSTSAWSAIDGDTHTYWMPAERTEGPHWLELMFAKPTDIARIVIHPEPLDADISQFHIRATSTNGELNNVTAGSPVTKLRIDLEKQSQLGVAEIEIYNSQGERIPLVLPNQIPMQRSSGIGYGEGVALLWNNSSFAALEALLYDYRFGISRDGNAFRVGHNPGWILKPGESAISKNAVLGVSPNGEAGHWFVTKYLQPNWRQHKQGDRQWDRYWAYNITSDDDWSLKTPEIRTLARALKKTREAYNFGFQYVGPDITALVSYDPYRLGVNPNLFPNGFEASAGAIASTGAAVEGYYGIGRPEESETAEARKRFRDTLTSIVERNNLKMLVFDGYVSGYGGLQPYIRERVWDNFRDTIESLQTRDPNLFIGIESFSPNTLTRWLWVNTQFDHHASHYLYYNPDARLNNVRAELIPDAGAGSAPVLHGRDVVTASAGVYDLFGVPWRGVETFGPLWQLIYNPFYQGASAMERSRDNWVMNLFGAATILSPVTYGRIFGQPPEDMSWLGRMLQLRNENLTVFAECKAKENGDIFHIKDDHGFAVFRNLRWAGSNSSFILDEEIGLTRRDQDYLVKQLYPVERIVTKPNGDWRWKYGESPSLPLEPFQLKLVSISPVPKVPEAVVTGCAYEEGSQGRYTLLGLPGEVCTVHLPDRTDAIAASFPGNSTEARWNTRIGDLAPLPNVELGGKGSDLLSRVDFVKAVAYPQAWRLSNLYGLLDYEKDHPYPYPEIEAARRINEGHVRASMKWLSDGNLETPPSATDRLSLTHAPIVFGQSVIQADLTSVRRITRIRAAVQEKLSELTVSFSSDGKTWSRVPLSLKTDYWESGVLDQMARYLRLDAEATAQEFQVFAQDANGSGRLLDWSATAPYPISFVPTLTKSNQIANVWSIHVRLPEKIYKGQKLAIPISLAKPAFVSDLWPLYRIAGQDRSVYDVVPGYAKSASASPKVMGLTFRMPLRTVDSGKELDVVIVSTQPLKKAETWIVTDSLPYVPKIWSMPVRKVLK